MSYWTHINGNIRYFSAYRYEDEGEPIMTEPLHFGNTVDFNDEKEKWKNCDVPCGQEGSLNYKYIKHLECENSIIAGTLVVWGDLRGYEEDKHPDIIKWLNMCCEKYREKGLFAQDGIVQINEHIYVYNEDTKIFELINRRK